ncbi:MAG: hypothetical protein AAGJ83_16020, partial [Planctomycetota bacterium]
VLAIQLHRGNAHRLEIKDLRLKTLEGGTIIPFDPDNLPDGAKRIDRPRTSRPEGKAPVPPRKAKS